MDFVFWSAIVLAIIVTISLVASFVLTLTIFLGPPDGFDVDVEDDLTTKERNYDSTKHKKTFR